MVFQAGQSGNPTGRPKGIKDKRMQDLERWRGLLEDKGEEIIKRAIDVALNNGEEFQCLRMCFDRLIPRLRPIPAVQELPTEVREELVEISELPINEQPAKLCKLVLLGKIPESLGSLCTEMLSKSYEVQEAPAAEIIAEYVKEIKSKKKHDS